MRRLYWLAGGLLGAVVAIFVGFNVETTGGAWHPVVLPQWLFHLAPPPSHLPVILPPYSAPYWAIGGFLIGALWVVLQRRD